MKLSILIPSKNEPYLQQTITDIMLRSVADTEILVGFDGGFALSTEWRPLYPERISWSMYQDGTGQRAITNKLARQARGDYLVKLDAHCSVGPAFDRILLEEMDEHTILAPTLLPLKGENWTINGKKRMNQFVFDTNLVMHHAEGEAGDTMCLQGSAWVVLRENYWKWNLGDETLGSWGGQGPELGIKAFLNGGRCRTTDRTYYGHVFRHADSDFPYDRGIEPGKYANTQLKDRYLTSKLAPLIERFNFPCDWSVDTVAKLRVV